MLTSTAGGLGQSVLTLLRQLDPDRYDLTVAFGPGYPLDDEFQKSGFNVVFVRFKRGLKFDNFFGFFDLYQFLTGRQFDIVHIHGGNEAGVLGRIAAKLAGCTYILYSLHGTPTVDRSAYAIRLIIRAFDFLLDFCTDQYVAVSHCIKQRYLDNGIGHGRIVVIHHGISLDDVDLPDSLENYRESLNIMANAVIVGSVGFLEEQKGIEYMIRAIPAVLEKVPNCHFVIVGDGPLKGCLEYLCQELGVLNSVSFLGWRDDAKLLLRTIDILCHPSLSESLGLVLLESMALAKPVVASNVQGIPEVVVHGETGLLTPPRNSSAIAAALLQLIGDHEQARNMGAKGRLRVLEYFSLEQMKRQYEDLYQEAINSSISVGYQSNS